MKLLDQRVCKLEKTMNERPPRLDGKSAQECFALFKAACQSDPDRSDLVLQGMSDEQLDGISNLFRARQGLPPEPPPLGTCTLAQIREHYPDFYKSLSAEKRAPDAWMYDDGKASTPR